MFTFPWVHVVDLAIVIPYAALSQPRLQAIHVIIIRGRILGHARGALAGNETFHYLLSQQNRYIHVLLACNKCAYPYL